MTQTRLAIVVSHPIQHFVHFYRAIAREPDIVPKVFFCSRMGLEHYFDVEMNSTIAWKTDLVGGYDHEFLPGAEAIANINFREVDNAGAGSQIASFRPDAVLIYGYATMTYLRALAWCRLNGVPALLISDSNVRKRRALRAFARHAMLLPLMRQYSAFLAVSDQNEEALRGIGVPSRKICRCPFSIDEAGFAAANAARGEARSEIRSRHGIPERAFLFLSIGKLIPHKRHGDLLDAVERLGPQPLERPVHVMICGNGALFDSVRDRIERNALPVTLAGFINVDRLPGHYVAADAFIHPSEREPFGLVCPEAAAAGLPMILSDRVGAIGPTGPARPGENALVYPCGDVAALTARMSQLLNDPAKGQAMSDASRKIFKDCNVAASIAGLRRALASIKVLATGTTGRA